MKKFRVPVTHYETGEFNRFLYETLENGIFMFNECMRDFPRELVIGKEEQFIERYDKKGKEIYENDICKIRFDIDKVEDYIFASLTEKEIRTCERVFVVESPLFNNQPELNADIIEIIGNIHENPELLND